jgi:hypothetical protein
VFFDDKGAVIGFGGLTVVEMPPHRFVVDGRTLYTGVRETVCSFPASSESTQQSSPSAYRSTRGPFSFPLTRRSPSGN